MASGRWASRLAAALHRRRPAALPQQLLTAALLMQLAMAACFALLPVAAASEEAVSDSGSDEGEYAHVALVTFTFKSDGPSIRNCTGILGHKSVVGKQEATLVHVKSSSNLTANMGCEAAYNAPSDQRWIALVQRGGCKFDVKVHTAARYNASAVVVYNFNDHDEPLVMAHDDHGIVTVMIDKSCGDAVARLADELEENGTALHVTIEPMEKIFPETSTEANGADNSFTRTSVLIVSITFIVLMIFSLAWLVFYYVQRFRFANMKDRITRQLAEAAKRAIKRIPKRSVCQADMVENNVCAVCIESYKDNDVVRELPCSHIFHKQCIDNWLIEKRVCPMCKLNILEALGVRVKGLAGSGGSAASSDAASASSRDGESGTWDIPMTTLLVSPSHASSRGLSVQQQPLRQHVDAEAGYDELTSLVARSTSFSAPKDASSGDAALELAPVACSPTPGLHTHQ